MSTLAAAELNRLDQLETVIERGLSTFVDVGRALAEVRDSRLYRQAHPTFEDYCRERWQLSRPRAYELIGAATAIENVSAMADIPGPQSERQARPLTRLEPEKQREAWQQAFETAPRSDGGEPQVTAAHVENVVREFEGKPAKMAAHIVEAVITDVIEAATADEAAPPGAASDGDFESDPLEELKHASNEIDRLNATIDSLMTSDLAKEVVQLHDRFSRLEARLQQSIKSLNESQRQARYGTQALQKIRRALDVEKNSQILPAIHLRVRFPA